MGKEKIMTEKVNKIKNCLGDKKLSLMSWLWRGLRSSLVDTKRPRKYLCTIVLCFKYECMYHRASTFVVIFVSAFWGHDVLLHSTCGFLCVLEFCKGSL